MSKEKLNQAHHDIYCLYDKVGEYFCKAMEENNSVSEIGIDIICTYGQCVTKRDFEIADMVLRSICDCDLETLFKRIKFDEEIR